MHKTICRYFLLFCLLTFQTKSSHAATWKTLTKGIRYSNFTHHLKNIGSTTIHAFELDPKKVAFDLLLSPKNTLGSSIKQLAQEKNALIAINGGFFTEKHQSIGLLMKDGKRINQLHKTSWWSIFLIEKNIPKIVKPNKFAEKQSIQIAIQAGPRVVINGNIPKFKDQRTNRTAVGINKKNKVIFLVTEDNGVLLKELGEIFRTKLFCQNAMALDGGSSTQAYAKIGKFHLDISGRTKVTNGLGVFRKVSNY